MQGLANTIKQKLNQDIIAPAADAYGVKKSTQHRLEKHVEREIDRKFEELQGDYEQKANVAKAEMERRQQEAESTAEFTAAETDFHATMEEAMQELVQSAQNFVQDTIQNKPAETIAHMERQKVEEEKQSVEDSVRAHLRGFARTIPSFIMAYGDGKLTLQNFDDYTEDDVFEEVTGITEADFRFLRDGGSYTDPETGEEKIFGGHLFDEIVFNDSVEEFWKKNFLTDWKSSV